MARKNRIVVSDGIYHIVSRAANRQFLFSDPAFKDRVVEWLHGIASFSGVEIYGYSILDNHVHILVRVPPVPERYWSLPKKEGAVPAGVGPCAEAFGMRPRECRPTRWTPVLGDAPYVITHAGETLSDAAVVASVSEGVPPVMLPRPPVGFSMSDDEMTDRLMCLYKGYSDGAEKISRRWRRLRVRGLDGVVEEEKESFCRRMYNVSQFVKTLKERSSSVYNAETGHTGALWETRFYSGLVDNERRALVMTTAYIDYNAVKAGIVRDASEYRWCSWARACGSDEEGAHYREIYERVFGASWDEARSHMESILKERLPERLVGLFEDEALRLLDEELDCPVAKQRDSPRRNGDSPREKAGGGHVAEGGGVARLTVGQAIKFGLRVFAKGAYVSFDPGFGRRVAKMMTRAFPMGDSWSLERCARYDVSCFASAA